MTNFINLTSRVINKLHIIEIIKKPNKYFIYMNESYISGTLFLSSGYVSSDRNIIEICENKQPQDYRIITNWIKNIPPV